MRSNLGTWKSAQKMLCDSESGKSAERFARSLASRRRGGSWKGDRCRRSETTPITSCWT